MTTNNYTAVMTEEQLREGFEAYLKSKSLCTDRTVNAWTQRNEYLERIELCWQTWQAAIAYLRTHSPEAVGQLSYAEIKAVAFRNGEAAIGLAQKLKAQDAEVERLKEGLNFYKTYAGCQTFHSDFKNADKLREAFDRRGEEIERLKAASRTRPDYDLNCEQCGASHWLDTVLPSAVWNQIAEPHNILCMICIDERLTAKSLTAEAEYYFVGDSLKSKLYEEPQGDVERLETELATIKVNADCDEKLLAKKIAKCGKLEGEVERLRAEIDSETKLHLTHEAEHAALIIGLKDINERLTQELAEAKKFVHAYTQWAVSTEHCGGPLFDAMVKARQSLGDSYGQ